MKLSYTRAMITAALEGQLDSTQFDTLPVFDLAYPTSCPGVPTELLNPKETWSDASLYDDTASKLASKFVDNFESFKEEAAPEILAAAPKILVKS